MSATVDNITESLKDSISTMKVSDFAEARIVLPDGLTSMPGPLRYAVNPYLREIADALSESSNVQEIAVMKGSRVGFSVGVGDAWMAYIIAQAPGSVLYVNADKETAQQTVELRFDRVLQSAGLAERIFSQSEKRNNRKSGDTKAMKQFPGGYLMAIGPNSAGKLRGYGIRYANLDEVDAWKGEVGFEKKEGDPVTLIKRRTDEYERIRKILYGSTPTIAGESRIEEMFAYGDQRYYYVPCRHCGHYQVLKWRDEHGGYRFKYELDEHGILVPESVHYVCEECGGHWRNADKSWFLPRGEWRPTARSRTPTFRSYHISALYSPIGMRSWESVVQEWIDIGTDESKRKAFVNTVLGETWQERGDAPDLNRVMLRREEYARGLLPDTANGKALFATLGADVHRDRIECEIVAWGKDKESWSIDYHVLEGETSDPSAAVWNELYRLITTPHAGLPVVQALIDSGYNTHSVYEFCERIDGATPAKGSTYTREWAVRRRTLKEHDTEIAEVNTDSLKAELYGYLRLGEPVDGEEFQRGYPHFPVDYDRRHFTRLMAETRVRERDKYGKLRFRWKLPHGSRNEQLDCRVYAMAALYLHAQMVAEQVFGEEQVIWINYWKWVQQTFPAFGTG